jgi:predicted CoA-binding protein
MIKMSIIQDFLSQRKLALAGVSARSRKFGNVILKDLKDKGYQVFIIHPTAIQIGEDRCYPSLASLPESVGGIVTCIPPRQAEILVREAERAGIMRIWMQPGSESPDVIDFCRQKNLNLVHGECILMFTTPLAVPHRLHRWIRRLLGKLPV